MSRRDYEQLAAAIRTADLGENAAPYIEVAQQLGVVLAADNPRFDYARFIDAATRLAKDGDRDLMRELWYAADCPPVAGRGIEP